MHRIKSSQSKPLTSLRDRRRRFGRGRSGRNLRGLRDRGVRALLFRLGVRFSRRHSARRNRAPRAEVLRRRGVLVRDARVPRRGVLERGLEQIHLRKRLVLPRRALLGGIDEELPRRRPRGTPLRRVRHHERDLRRRRRAGAEICRVRGGLSELLRRRSRVGDLRPLRTVTLWPSLLPRRGLPPVSRRRNAHGGREIARRGERRRRDKDRVGDRDLRARSGRRGGGGRTAVPSRGLG